MKEYWSDKRKAPWHRLYDLIEKEWDWKKGDIDDLKQRLLLIRDGVFASMEMLSLSLAIDLPTQELLQILTKAKDWSSGKRAVREKCAKIVNRLISEGEITQLVPAALERDGFGFLVGPLQDALISEYREAQPTKKKKHLDVSALSESILGRRLLREQMISEAKLPLDDPRVEPLLEAFDRYLIELELDERAVFPALKDTDQLTLNGSIVPEKETEKEHVKKPDSTELDLADLTEFLEGEEKTKKARKPKTKGKGSASRKKGGRSK
ncbi:MAG: hypothetical protein EAX95_13435 [Candidatus Thorarchaeota archaeon]|nr:hypothetical protein [Candidatus Thorarchaeota archaeon]